MKVLRTIGIFLAGFAMVAGTLVQAAPAQASHFRGSLVTVEYHAGSGGEVHVTSTTLTRKNAPDGMYGVDVYLDTNGTLTPLNCQSTSSQTVDTNNPIFEIQQNIFTLTGCFGTPGDYVFAATTCCRIGGIINTPNSDIQFQARINIDGINDSSAPVYNSGYMYNIAYDPALSYSTNLGGVGQGNTAVTYSLVDGIGSVIDEYGSTRIPCSNLDTITGQFRVNSTFCTGTEDIVTDFSGGQKLYALKVRATDVYGQYSTRDVLLNFDTTTNQSPAFTTTPQASAFTVTPGSTSTATFCAQDPDAADVLNFTSSPTRSWITMGSVTADNATTPTTYCVDFTIAPPLGTAEAFNFEVSVYDNYSNFVRSASGLYSVQAGAVVPTPGNPTPPNPPAPVVQREPTNPEVQSIDPRNVELGKETVVTITGIRLSGVSTLSLNGNLMTIISNDDKSIVFLVTPQYNIDFGEVEFIATGGKLTWQQALKFVTLKTLPRSNTALVSGFAPGSSILITSVKAQLRAVASQLSSVKTITCSGLTSGTRVTAQDVKLSLDRAKAACNYLVKITSTGAKLSMQSQTLGEKNGSIRGVSITYSK